MGTDNNVFVLFAFVLMLVVVLVHFSLISFFGFIFLSVDEISLSPNESVVGKTFDEGLNDSNYSALPYEPFSSSEDYGFEFPFVGHVVNGSLVDGLSIIGIIFIILLVWISLYFFAKVFNGKG
jgi:hypothetical protein